MTRATRNHEAIKIQTAAMRQRGATDREISTTRRVMRQRTRQETRACLMGAKAGQKARSNHRAIRRAMRTNSRFHGAPI